MICPICSKETEAKYRPFCSRRCADIDLGRWLNESYVIPAKDSEDERPAPPETPDPATLN